MTGPLWLVGFVVCVAFVAESALGFGSTVIAVAVGSMLVPMRPLLAALVPLNLVLSAYFTVRYRRDVDRPVLLRRVLPFMLAAMPVGMLVAARLPESWLKRAFGGFVFALSCVELARAARDAPVKPLPESASRALLVVGGAVHGMFGVGGPLAVYVVSRWITAKGRFRATLNALWLTLNVVFLVPYVREGLVSAQSLRESLALSPALLVGMVVGEVAHRRVPQRQFRTGVYVMLLVAGAMLVARG